MQEYVLETDVMSEFFPYTSYFKCWIKYINIVWQLDKVIFHNLDV